MANYEVPANPVYNANVRKLENEDTISADDTFNPLVARLVENTAAVRKEVEGKAKADLSNVATSVFSGIMVGNADTVDGKHAADLQNYNNLTNRPTIPTTLPANGGNADTVDGKHAADLQNYSNLTNKPTIPTTLPANGGNADTVDGKHAVDLQNYNNLTGKPVLTVVATSGNYNDLSNKPVIPAAVSTRSFTATLSATAWSGSGPFTQTISVSGILSTDNPVTDVVQSLTVDTAKQQLEGWVMVSRVDTANGSITAYCYEEKPSVALPIVMEVVR